MKPGRLQPQTRQPDSHFLTLTKQKGYLRKTEHGTDMKHQEGRLGEPGWGRAAGSGGLGYHREGTRQRFSVRHEERLLWSMVFSAGGLLQPGSAVPQP